jgi:uncharacterized protein YkwD
MTSRLSILSRRLVGVALTVMALSPALVVTAPAAQAYTPSYATMAGYEARVIAQMNVQRARYGLGRLTASACPDVYAERWARYLANNWKFFHQGLFPILKACSAARVAENLARGAIGADRVVALWMASPGHRANVLDGRLTKVGVAAVFARGQWVVAANFTRA